MFRFLFAFLVATSCYADTIQFCSPTVASVQSVAGPNGYTTTVNATTTLTQGACAAPVPTPPAGAVSCTEKTPSDVAGYSAHCAGPFTLHSGGQDTVKGPASYSFKFTFGNNVNDWPGGPFGTSEIFVFDGKQYLSIPFKPVTGHTITVNEAQTYTPHPISISVSTVPGRFNNAKPGNGVVCVKSGGQPSLILSSNGGTAQCQLDRNTQYWINIIPAYIVQGVWKNDYVGSAKVGITVYSQN